MSEGRAARPPLDMSAAPLSPRVLALREGAVSAQGEFHQWYQLWAESLAETAGEPLVVRRAKAFAHMCQEMELALPPGALIVGRHPRTVIPSEEARRIRDEWARVARPPDDSELHYQTEGLFRASVITLHVAPGTDRVLRTGLGGLRDDIARRLTEAKEQSARDLLRAALIAVGGGQRFIRRYAELTEAAAAAEADPERKRELKGIAADCRRIESQPPDSFRAAIQLVWFVYLLINLECTPFLNASSPGTIDRWLADYYRRDVESGRLTPEQALELIQCLCVEMNASLSRGGILPLTTGGIDERGEPAETELTWLCLKAATDLRLLHPSLSLRCHRNMPSGLLREALRAIGSGCTYPALFNDDVCVPSLRRAGVSDSDSVDWVHSVCTELTAVGKTHGWIAGPYLNLAKCLELALNNGRCLLTGAQLGPDLGSLASHADFEALYQAYLGQLSHVVDLGIAAARRAKLQARERTPYPLLSCFTADCLERARDYNDCGCRYQPNYVHGIGMSTAADSLAAIRTLVYDQRLVAPEMLLAALKSDFAGFEVLRQQLLNRAPKYGNDNDEADAIAVRVVNDFYREVEGRPDGAGGTCYPGFMTWETHNLLGKGTGATADGRRAGAALSDSVGAVQGRDREGLTALFRSVTKVDYLPSVGGVTFNVKLSPEFFGGDEMLARLEAAIGAYFAAGGFQLQVNVVSREMLEEARMNPDAHRNLIVRVGGFSAYFVELDAGIQEEIIARTMH
ncbi:MAG: pyruvate formate lyase family protein [Armatimonadota bacterium]